MGAPPGSQVAPLPTGLPFRLVSKTIGSGAYASIRKAIPRNKSSPVVAIKFINKDHAFRTGRLKPKQIELEIGLHKHVTGHLNIIKFITHGMDSSWLWIAMELAEGGDLFDKIEADEGVGEDIAHFYFRQLVAAVSWCHGKGVAHRDIKPENMLLSKDGDLKLADFGMAVQYCNPNTGATKRSGLVCGSPPYIAPEILLVGEANKRRKPNEIKYGYSPDISDIWSCAIVLFVLLVGNTPWDMPDTTQSEEFLEFCDHEGRPEDELWSKIPTEAISLLRGMLRTEPEKRFTFNDIRIHSWYTQTNAFMNEKGTSSDSVRLATTMIERLHINLDEPPPKPETVSQPTTAAAWPSAALASSTQPETPANDQPFDWEAPPRLAAQAMSASQPLTSDDRTRAAVTHDLLSAHLAEEPHMTQFSQNPAVPLSLTQHAQRFQDIVPSHSLARFYSSCAMAQVLGQLRSALHTLNVPVGAGTAGEETAREAFIRIQLLDGRKQGLSGSVVVEKLGPEGLVEVRFIKKKGDPLEWRRLFKRVVQFCRDIVFRPAEQ